MSLIKIKINGVTSLPKVIGLIDKTLDEDWAILWQAFMRPTKAPGMKDYAIRKQFTLEGSTQQAFDNSGRNVYFDVWTAYPDEPRYQRVKEKVGGGTNVLVWQGSKNPLRAAFIKGHEDHVMKINKKTMRWGAGGRKGEIAAKLATGGFYQPWDKITVSTKRPIIRINEAMAIEVCKGMQSVLRGRLGIQGYRAARSNL